MRQIKLYDYVFSSVLERWLSTTVVSRLNMNITICVGCDTNCLFDLNMIYDIVL